ncbi:family 43 glycosylhydrolase [Caldicellulosiruptoraceae bacterium PP1]
MSSEQIKYKNPLTVYKVADPFILKYNNKYYLYATSERGAGMSGGFEVWESPDLVNFEYKGFAYKSNEKSWGFDSFWAPEVLYYNGKFYLFYSAAGMIDGNKTLRICLAESNSPLGPFVDIKAPLFDFGYAAIDAHPFVDNGQVYLYYSRDCSENPTSDIYVVKLSKDLKNTIGEAKFLLTPSQSWEIGAKWNEGPFVVKHNNKYYLFYSANFYASPDYSVGYAVSNNPLGPFIKAKENPILKKNSFVTGPGHNSVVKSPDDREYFIVYHTQMIKEGTYLRQLAIDRLLFTKDGKVKVIGPTYTPQPLPSGSKVPKLASSDNFNSTKLDRSKWFIIGQNNISLTAKKGNLRIKTYQTNLQNIKNDNLDVSNIIIQYTNDLNFSIETSLSPLQKSYGDRAGLIIFQDYDNYIELVRIDGDKKTYIEFYYCLKGTIFSKKIEISNSSKNIALKIEKKANKYTSMYKSDNNKKWTNIAEYSGSNFDITRVGITAYSPMSTDSIYDFDYFNYTRIVK